MDVLIVGSGVAGLTAALRLAGRHDVTLVTKGRLTDGSTGWAQGGIAVALGADDAPALHAAATLRAASGLADPAAVDVLCGDGPNAIRSLLALGVPFDRSTHSADIAQFGDDLARGLEAAHDRRRILHARGDATGAALEETLAAAVRRSPARILERTHLVDLIIRGGAVVGAQLVGAGGTPIAQRADAVILASGGAGRLYSTTTNPVVATGDGQAAAWRAGAVLTDLEFVQFHPTRLAVDGGPLISEAVRGEGARLLDASGRPFMAAVHPAAELAPRDVVARAIAAAIVERGGPVLLDATALERSDPGFLTRRFPGLTRATRAAGFDWRVEAVPVTPAAHYAMGGVATDLDGRTSIPGLFAAGEVACTGVHGANRLASNSLLEGLVFAARAADAIDRPYPERVAVRGSTTVEVVPDAMPSAVAPDRAASIASGTRLPADSVASPSVRQAVQTVMEARVGLLRDEAGLARALRDIEALRADRSLRRGVSAVPESVDASETENLLDLARLTIVAAASRTESRGAHARTDCPATDPNQARPRAWRRVDVQSASAFPAEVRRSQGAAA
ncbi:L-aspartate oxidase [Curtobacterium ammoniigenes]|uniref:L-aspartate oxidase n=1 Tax=Curtobacterium ammoniigenes TaxID=395387 RepID=UPI00082FA8EA|nr:L-aspartate oxidase [Curtobacterium ammoniigenes]